MSYADVFTKLGLAKNEANIYETLLLEGESNVANIAIKSKIHRRNVYDSLNRLIEKGLVFEIIQQQEKTYKAVDPDKLAEIIAEKQEALKNIMPQLKQMYSGKPHKNEVYVYKGIEGFKNYMRDIIRLGEDDYIIGGKGLWADPKIVEFAKYINAEATKKGIKFYCLYDEVVKKEKHPVLDTLPMEIAFLPEKYFTYCSMDIFADRVVILSDIGRHGELNDKAAFTVIVNRQVADAMRTWWKALWSIAKKQSINF